MGSEKGEMKQVGSSSSSNSQIVCSICFNDVLENDERARAILQCGHKFHLDCIGSAINFKRGVMQCPNCRKVENGEWRLAKPTLEDELQSLEDEFESLMDHETVTIYFSPLGEPSLVPFNYEPLNSSSLGGSEVTATAISSEAVGGTNSLATFSNLSDEGRIHHPFNDQDGVLTIPRDLWTLYTGMRNPQNPSEATHHGGNIHEGPAPLGTAGTIGDVSLCPPIPGSGVHPMFLNRRSGARAGNPMTSVFPTYPGAGSVNRRANDRVEARHAHQQLPSNPHMPVSNFTFGMPMGQWGGLLPAGLPMFSNHGRNNMLNFTGPFGRESPAPANPALNQFYACEQDQFDPFLLMPGQGNPNWWQTQVAPPVPFENYPNWWQPMVAPRMPVQSNPNLSQTQVAELMQLQSNLSWWRTQVAPPIAYQSNPNWRQTQVAPPMPSQSNPNRWQTQVARSATTENNANFSQTQVAPRPTFQVGPGNILDSANVNYGYEQIPEAGSAPTQGNHPHPGQMPPFTGIPDLQ